MRISPPKIEQLAWVAAEDLRHDLLNDAAASDLGAIIRGQRKTTARSPQHWQNWSDIPPMTHSSRPLARRSQTF